MNQLSTVIHYLVRLLVVTVPQLVNVKRAPKLYGYGREFAERILRGTPSFRDWT